MSRRILPAMFLLLTVCGCSKEPAPGAAQKPQSQREKDSVLAQSKIPGASGVGKAMTVADSAGNRVHVQDSVATSE